MPHWLPATHCHLQYSLSKASILILYKKMRRRKREGRLIGAYLVVNVRELSVASKLPTYPRCGHCSDSPHRLLHALCPVFDTCPGSCAYSSNMLGNFPLLQLLRLLFSGLSILFQILLLACSSPPLWSLLKTTFPDHPT